MKSLFFCILCHLLVAIAWCKNDQAHTLQSIEAAAKLTRKIVSDAGTLFGVNVVAREGLIIEKHRPWTYLDLDGRICI